MHPCSIQPKASKTKEVGGNAAHCDPVPSQKSPNRAISSQRTPPFPLPIHSTCASLSTPNSSAAQARP
ncbi:hypothetical protein MYCTH_2306523 [Thermothelomyces thermophilus ATCC 42464]|uniref:Uncharacterized protein n=1 Tax=Thermothelomyces thermophilus (strain ATCC 42464 / BCRC 31852 / DSM 1799) TaxID=573729 RepID=G2QHJ4_THET4|nr:uncharacterized protein MYCTH_2306523 [Thermothelomyces thermophilus ATCC 42464]AEO58854.1 hypothetical protein MYCTH_2306523 [Thermothelomyces thermophilus ATCC 42464]